MVEVQTEMHLEDAQERGAVAMQLKDVAVSFHGRTAVRDCTFDVTKNKVTSLIGPSGSGKTTLLRALNRLHDLTPGAKVSGKYLTRRRGHLSWQPNGDGTAYPCGHGLSAPQPLSHDVDL